MNVYKSFFPFTLTIIIIIIAGFLEPSISSPSSALPQKSPPSSPPSSSSSSLKSFSKRFRLPSLKNGKPLIRPETREWAKTKLEWAKTTFHPKNILLQIKKNPKKAATLVLAISLAMAIWNSFLATSSAKIIQSQMDPQDPYKDKYVMAASVQGAVDGALTPLLFVGMGPVKTTLANQAGASVLGVSDHTKEELILPSLAAGAVDNVVGLTPATFFAGSAATGVQSTLLNIAPVEAAKSSAIAVIDPNGAQLLNTMMADKDNKKEALEAEAQILKWSQTKYRPPSTPFLHKSFLN